MPGIVGLITAMPKERAERELARMLACLQHEPTYTSGIHVDESSGVYAGWVARKASFASAMPVRNESGDVTLLFSGEEFPPAGTLQNLKERKSEAKRS